MSKKYKLSFNYKDDLDLTSGNSSTGIEICLDYDSYEEVLKEAKLYFSVFFEVIWRKSNIEKKLNLSFVQVLEEALKVADSFTINPNESNFDFIEYAKYLDKLYRFELEMQWVWKGLLSEHLLLLGDPNYKQKKLLILNMNHN